MAYLILQAALVYCAHLLQQNDRILFQMILPAFDFNMGRQLRLIHPARDGGADDRRTVLVPDIVLYNQNRADTSLLGADDRPQIRIKNISSFYNQILHNLSNHTFGQPFCNYSINNFYSVYSDLIKLIGKDLLLCIDPRHAL